MGEQFAADLAERAGQQVLNVQADAGNVGQSQPVVAQGDDWLDKAAAALPMGKLGQVDEIADFIAEATTRSSREHRPVPPDDVR